MAERNFKPLFTWRSAICDSGLPPTTRHVALTLSLHMNERGGSCFPGAALLATETGLSERSVREHLRQLVDSGWIVITEHGGIRGTRKRANAYEAAYPGTLAGDAGVGEATPASERADPCDSCTPGRNEGDTERASKSTRARNLHYDALVAVFGDATTKSEATFIAKYAHELKAAGATPEQIVERGNRMRAKGGAWAEATPAALAKHWTALGRGDRPNVHDQVSR